MRLWLAAVGRLRSGPLRDLVDDYLGRLTWPVTEREVECRRRLPPAELRHAEAGLLLAAVPPGATVVALDARGAELTSEALAARLGRWQEDGVGDLAFLIGGAGGHGAAVLDRAALLLAFGRMTWPHLLVRAMLAEQLYRAQAILGGHPYHRG